MDWGALPSSLPRVLHALLAAANSNDADVRTKAVAAIGMVGRDDPACIELLVALVDSEGSDLAGPAIESLHRIGDGSSLAEECLLRAQASGIGLLARPSLWNASAFEAVKSETY